MVRLQLLHHGLSINLNLKYGKTTAFVRFTAPRWHQIIEKRGIRCRWCVYVEENSIDEATCLSLRCTRYTSLISLFLPVNLPRRSREKEAMPLEGCRNFVNETINCNFLLMFECFWCWKLCLNVLMLEI